MRSIYPNGIVFLLLGLTSCGDQVDSAPVGASDTLGGAAADRAPVHLEASLLRRVCNLDQPYKAQGDGYVSLKNDDLVYVYPISGDSLNHRVHRLDHAAEGKFPGVLNGKVTICDFSWHRRMISSGFKAVLMPSLPHAGDGITMGPEDFVDVASLSAEKLVPVRNEHLTLIRLAGSGGKWGWVADNGAVLIDPTLGRVVKGLPSQTYTGVTITSYYPSSDPLQGGFNDRFGVPLEGRTINDFMVRVKREGYINKPYVVVAMDYKVGRDNQFLRIPEMETLFGSGCIPFKVRDTGGAFINRGYAKIDVLAKDHATSYTVIGKRSGHSAIFYNEAYPCR
jgi:hypothetical protein